jgi:transposase
LGDSAGVPISRGRADYAGVLFTIRSLKSFVPSNQPLRPIRELLNTTLVQMDQVFDVMYAKGGREPIEPEKLLRALSPQALYGIRGGRLLVEPLGHNPLVRWFVDASIQDAP